MKKYPLVILFAVILLFTGCAPQMQREKGQADFSFPDTVSLPFSAVFGTVETSGNIVYSDSQLEIEFSEPETVSRLTVSVNKEKTEFSFNGLTVSKNNNPVLKKLNANTLFSVLENAKVSTNIIKTDGGFLVSGDGYEIEFDSLCRIKKITIPERKIEMVFEP